ncbi:MAG: YdcF family protein [Dongiaceae bacterium]
MDELLAGAIRALLLPPTVFWLLVVLGWAVRRRWRRPGGALVLAGLALLLLSSLPACADLLLGSLETDPPVTQAEAARAEVLVVLGGDLDRVAPEYGGTTLGPLSLERVRYAAILQRRTGLPLLVTGGPLWPGGVPVSEVMAQVLRAELGVPVRWVEDQSDDTWDNAARSARILAGAGLHRVLLVTQAWHMRRARIAFRAAGLEVIAAPTGITGAPGLTALSLVPSAAAAHRSFYAMHEWLGTLWYELRRRRG